MPNLPKYDPPEPPVYSKLISVHVVHPHRSKEAVININYDGVPRTTMLAPRGTTLAQALMIVAVSMKLEDNSGE